MSLTVLRRLFRYLRHRPACCRECGHDIVNIGGTYFHFSRGKRRHRCPADGCNCERVRI